MVKGHSYPAIMAEGKSEVLQRIAKGPIPLSGSLAYCFNVHHIDEFVEPCVIFELPDGLTLFPGTIIGRGSVWDYLRDLPVVQPLL